MPKTIRCDICEISRSETDREFQDYKHFSIYVTGSEGVVLCFNCRVAVSNFLRTLKETAGRVRHEEHKNNKKRIT